MIAWRKLFTLALLALSLAVSRSSAQQERSLCSTIGADFLSSYIWRGTQQGSGPHIQPYMEFTAGRFTAGAWGTTDFRNYSEADLYLEIELPAGFTIGLQDYYLPDLEYFDYSRASGSHALEVSLAYEADYVNLGAGYVINEAGGIGSWGGDLYFEAELSFEYFSVFMGAGTGWHTVDGSFNVCSLGISVNEKIHITDKFSIPFSCQLIFNPDSQKMFIVAGFTIASGNY